MIYNDLTGNDYTGIKCHLWGEIYAHTRARANTTCHHRTVGDDPCSESTPGGTGGSAQNLNRATGGMGGSAHGSENTTGGTGRSAQNLDRVPGGMGGSARCSESTPGGEAPWAMTPVQRAPRAARARKPLDKAGYRAKSRRRCLPHRRRGPGRWTQRHLCVYYRHTPRLGRARETQGGSQRRMVGG